MRELLCAVRRVLNADWGDDNTNSHGIKYHRSIQPMGEAYKAGST
jgi:hypothetical protein